MAKTFEETLIEEIVRVPWLGGPTGRAIAGTIGAAQEAEVRRLRDAALMKCPGLAPGDALPLLGLDRMLRRAPPQTDAAYAEWLERAGELWEQVGTTAGFVNVFTPYGFNASTVTVLNNHEVSGFWDGNEIWHSRVFLFLDSRDAYFSSDGTWSEDPGAPSDVWSEDESASGATWDSSATVGDLGYFRASLRDFKAPESYPVTIAVWLFDTMPDGYWESPGLPWPEDDADADGAVWCEDSDCHPLYWTIGHVWGEEVWTGDGADTWEEGEEEMTDLEESEKWVAFAGEEV